MAGSQFTLLFDDPAAGWLTVEVSANGQAPVRLWASYLTDAPADLSEAVLAMLNGAPEARCAWAGEPPEYRWVFTRAGDRIRVRLLQFPHYPARLEDERGEPLLETDCTPRRLASQVKGQLHQLLNRLGPVAYETAWQRPFPFERFQDLERRLNEYRSTGASE